MRTIQVNHNQIRAIQFGGRKGEDDAEKHIVWLPQGTHTIIAETTIDNLYHYILHFRQNKWNWAETFYALKIHIDKLLLEEKR
jgi:hypothetical protein